MTQDKKICSGTDETKSKEDNQNQVSLPFPDVSESSDQPKVLKNMNQTLNSEQTVQSEACATEDPVALSDSNAGVQQNDTDFPSLYNKDISGKNDLNKAYSELHSPEIKIQVEPPENLQLEKPCFKDLRDTPCLTTNDSECAENIASEGAIEICPVPSSEIPTVVQPQNTESEKSSIFEEIIPEEGLDLKVNQNVDHTENSVSEGDVIRNSPAPASPDVQVKIQTKPKDSKSCCLSQFFRRRLKVALAQLDRNPFMYGIIIIVDVTLAVTKLLEPLDENYDVFCAVFIVSLFCAMFSLLIEPGIFRLWVKKMQPSNCSCLFCIYKSYKIKQLSKKSQYASNPETDTSFVHEVADTSEISDANLPQLMLKHQENMGSESTDCSPNSPIAVNVDVHGRSLPLHSFELASEGKTSSSRTLPGSPSSQDTACVSQTPLPHEVACGKQIPISDEAACERQTLSSDEGACGNS